MQQPEIKKKKGISPIWILPIVALLVGGWLLYQGIQNAGVDIVVHFENGEGITVGKTKVMYKGIPIGIVRDMNVDRELKSIALTIEMDKRTKEGLVEDTLFWVVKPQVSAGRISGLNTLLSGSYIEVQRGVSKVGSREFTGLPDPPGKPENAPGLHFKLKAEALGSIQKGSNIYYKNIVVGSVQDFTLLNGEGVEIDAFVEPEFTHLIKTSTRFWNSSGISFKGGLSGFKLHMESMATLIYGGISLYTPEEKMDDPLTENGHVFTLYEDYDAAEYGIKMTLNLPSAMGLTEDVSKVMYRGFVAGVVTGFTFNNDENRSVTAHVLINPEAEFCLRDETKFWVVEPKLSVNRVENLETLVKGTHITFQPGDGEFRDTFIAVEQPRAEEMLLPGTSYKLISENSKSFSIGAPVLYKKLQVGELIAYDLTADGERIEATIFIYEKYAHLVKADSVFWKVGGIKLDASLMNGITVDTGTMTTLIAGGVSFGSSGKAKKKEAAAKENTLFSLYESYHDATKAIPTLKPKGLNFQIRAESTKAFSVGSPILFKHIGVGEIKGFHLAENEQDVILDVFIRHQFSHLLKTTSRFYNVSGITVDGGIGDFELKTGSVKSILVGGIAFYTPVEGEAAEESYIYELYDDYEEALDVDKVGVTIRFAEPKGLKAGVEIRYQGIRIGELKEVKYTLEMDSVVAVALVDQDAEKLFLTDTMVWLVLPEIALSGISNLETLIKGPYIAVTPGVGEPSLEIEARSSPPSLRDEIKDGLNIVLQAPTLGSLKPNSPVYYRQVKVGKVVGFDLSGTAQEVLIYVNIEEPYDALIHENTVFWNASGINVDAGLFSGVQINTESFEAIVAGGVALATPDGEAMGAQVEAEHHFTLHDKVNEQWFTWKPELDLTEE